MIRNDESNEISFRATISEWHELLFTLCPNIAGFNKKFDFNREDILSKDEILLLDSISWDNRALSISEGYEEYKTPNFENAVGYRTLYGALVIHAYR